MEHFTIAVVCCLGSWCANCPPWTIILDFPVSQNVTAFFLKESKVIFQIGKKDMIHKVRILLFRKVYRLSYFRIAMCIDSTKIHAPINIFDAMIANGMQHFVCDCQWCKRFLNFTFSTSRRSMRPLAKGGRACFWVQSPRLIWCDFSFKFSLSDAIVDICNCIHSNVHSKEYKKKDWKKKEPLRKWLMSIISAMGVYLNALYKVVILFYLHAHSLPKD